jgi:hypothetical protein
MVLVVAGQFVNLLYKDLGLSSCCYFGNSLGYPSRPIYPMIFIVPRLRYDEIANLGLCNLAVDQRSKRPIHLRTMATDIYTAAELALISPSGRHSRGFYCGRVLKRGICRSQIV